MIFFSNCIRTTKVWCYDSHLNKYEYIIYREAYVEMA